jgi:hypothetical protein
LDGVKVELEGLEKSAKSKAKKRYRAYRKTLKEWKNDLEWGKGGSTKNELLGDMKSEDQVDLNSNEGLAQAGRTIMQDNKDSLARTAQVSPLLTFSFLSLATFSLLSCFLPSSFLYHLIVLFFCFLFSHRTLPTRIYSVKT